MTYSLAERMGKASERAARIARELRAAVEESQRD